MSLLLPQLDKSLPYIEEREKVEKRRKKIAGHSFSFSQLSRRRLRSDGGGVLLASFLLRRHCSRRSSPFRCCSSMLLYGQVLLLTLLENPRPDFLDELVAHTIGLGVKLVICAGEVVEFVFSASLLRVQRVKQLLASGVAGDAIAVAVPTP